MFQYLLSGFDVGRHAAEFNYLEYGNRLIFGQCDFLFGCNIDSRRVGLAVELD